MSEESIESLKRGYEAFSSGDLEAALAFIHPEVEWHEFRETPGRGGAVYRGHEGMREVVRDWSAWEDLKSEVEEGVSVSDDSVLLMVRISGRVPGSAQRMEASIAHLWTMRDGKGYRMKSFWSRAEALEAAGLSE